ncbi:MAG TPA: response regulator [Verrucomicrobiae bacterium]|jgi:DNA-binding response OmpR family regulator
MSRETKILIVEDDLPVAMMMTSLLALAGIESEVATTGQKALQKAADGHFTLITLNVDLPDVPGFEVCRRLKENPFFHTPIVFVSGRPTEENQQRSHELGAVDFIAKPFRAEEFARRLLFHIQSEPKLC